MAAWHQKRKENRLKRDNYIREEFNRLHSEQRRRLDDCFNELGTRYGLSQKRLNDILSSN